MSLWLVAVVPADARPEADDVESSVIGRLRVVHREVEDEGDRTPSLDRLREHAALVESLHRTQPAVLPFRFGQVASDRRALADRLDSASADLEASLREVAGRSQWTLRLLESGAEETPSARAEKPSSGAEYLRSLRDRASWPSEPGDIAALQGALAEISVRQKIRIGRRAGWRAATYYLVEGARGPLFRETVVSSGLSGEGRRWSMTGPGAAWAFGP